jgi:hypothetical protein
MCASFGPSQESYCGEGKNVENENKRKFYSQELLTHARFIGISFSAMAYYDICVCYTNIKAYKHSVVLQHPLHVTYFRFLFNVSQANLS